MTFQQRNEFDRLASLYRTHQTTARSIAIHLGLSLRHVRRLLEEGRGHLPVPRQGWNRLCDEIRNYLVEEKRTSPTINCQWLSELAGDRFERPISRSSVWRVLKEAGLLDKVPTRHILRERFETASCGEVVQMDTTWGYWLGERKLYLILLLDDHSRSILAARFFLEETLWHNMAMVREVVETHGLFKVLYTDNAVWFKVIRHNRSIYQTHHQEEYEGEVAHACRELGIVHVTHKPYQPQGKGKVERVFRFIQERFVSTLKDPHMGLELVNTRFKEWVIWYNTKHINRTTGETPQKRFDPTGFKPLRVTERRKLDDIFCIRETRTVDKCNEFGYGGCRYRIPGNRSYAHRKVDLRIHPKQKIRVWVSGAFICELTIIQ